MPSEVDARVRVFQIEPILCMGGGIFANSGGKSGDKVMCADKDATEFDEFCGMPENVAHRLNWHFFKHRNRADHVEIVLGQIGLALATQQSATEGAIRRLGPDLIIETSFPLDGIGRGIVYP